MSHSTSLRSDVSFLLSLHFHPTRMVFPTKSQQRSGIAQGCFCIPLYFTNSHFTPVIFYSTMIMAMCVYKIILSFACLNIPLGSPYSLQPQSASRRSFLSNSFIVPAVGVLGSGVLLPPRCIADGQSARLYKAWSAGDGFLDGEAE